MAKTEPEKSRATTDTEEEAVAAADESVTREDAKTCCTGWPKTMRQRIQEGDIPESRIKEIARAAAWKYSVQPADREEIANDTYSKVYMWESHVCNLESYTFTVAENLCRKRADRRRRSEQAMRVVGVEVAACAETLSIKDRERVQRCFDEWKARDKCQESARLIELEYFEGCTPGEAVRILFEEHLQVARPAFEAWAKNETRHGGQADLGAEHLFDRWCADASNPIVSRARDVLRAVVAEGASEESAVHTAAKRHENALAQCKCRARARLRSYFFRNGFRAEEVKG